MSSGILLVADHDGWSARPSPVGPVGRRLGRVGQVHGAGVLQGEARWALTVDDVERQALVTEAARCPGATVTYEPVP